MFFVMYKEKPDLYGPFWILTTLIAILAILGNLGRYFDLLSQGKADKYSANFNFIPTAAIVIYFAGFGLPLALKLIMKFLGTGFFASSYIEVWEKP